MWVKSKTLGKRPREGKRDAEERGYMRHESGKKMGIQDRAGVGEGRINYNKFLLKMA